MQDNLRSRQGTPALEPRNCQRAWSHCCYQTANGDTIILSVCVGSGQPKKAGAVKAGRARATSTQPGSRRVSSPVVSSRFSVLFVRV